MVTVTGWLAPLCTKANRESTKMKIRQWLGVCATVLLIACSDDNKQVSTPQNEKSPTTKSSTPRYLDQNWSHETRMEWWFTSQGSRIMPYDWFLALERLNSNELLSSKENLGQYRFIAWVANPKWNPDGLPIGFVADNDNASGTRYIGVTCAACHTGKITYQGTEYIVDGAPAHHDFDRFMAELAYALQQTLTDNDKFLRFSNRLLGANPKPEAVAELKGQLSQESAKLVLRATINKPPHPNGYARLDAFGNIFNETTVVAINEPGNAKLANAPVSYPILWDTPHLDVVQWNGIAVNAGIGPYARNVGEVVGVFGDLHIGPTTPTSAPELSFNNHVNIANLKRLEDILATLWSPLWPEKTLPAIDREKAALGKVLYDQNCVSCHHAITRDEPARKIAASLVSAADIGTDPIMATNILTQISKTGILAGQPIFPVSQFVPDLPRFSENDLSVQMVLFGVVGILREGLDMPTLTAGLPAFLHASKNNLFMPNCDQNVDGLKCLYPPRYKARPLNGIWASAPFLHNGSVPNLWELLQKPAQRVSQFNVGSWEIDPVKVGFVTVPEPATSKFNAADALPGNSNQGHTYGTELSDKEKWALLEYLKTL